MNLLPVLYGPLVLVGLVTIVATSTTSTLPTSFTFRRGDQCPFAYKEALLRHYNQQRRQAHLSLLALSVDPEFSTHHNVSMIEKSIRRPKTKVFTEPTSTLLQGLDFNSQKNREKALDWKDATKISFSCSLMDNRSDKSTILHLGVFIDKQNRPAKPEKPTTCPAPSTCPAIPKFTPYPTCPTVPSTPPTTTPSPRSPGIFKVRVNTFTCPEAISKAIFQRLHTQRIAKNATAFILSEDLSDIAQTDTIRLPRVDIAPKRKEYGQLRWQNWWDGRHMKTITFSIDQPFKEKWNSSLSLPFYRPGNGKAKQYQLSEWLAAKEIGIGCSVVRSDREGLHLVTLHLAVYFKWNGPREEAVKPKSIQTEEETTDPEKELPDVFNFPVPSSSCPFGFTEAIVNLLNSKRNRQHNPLLSYMTTLTGLALKYTQAMSRSGGIPADQKSLLPANYITRHYSQSGNSSSPKLISVDPKKVIKSFTKYAPPAFSREQWKAAREAVIGCLATEKKVHLTLLLGIDEVALKAMTKAKAG